MEFTDVDHTQNTQVAHLSLVAELKEIDDGY